MTTQVQTAVIADGSITTAKFDPAAKCPSATSADSAINATNATNATNVTGTGTVGTTQLAASAVTPAKIAQPFTQGTAVNSTSGTSIDFTSIPSWVKRITVMFSGVSTSGSSSVQVQIGSGSVTASGYNSSSAFHVFGSSTNGTSSTSGFVAYTSGSSDTKSGQMVLTNVGGNVWVASHSMKCASNVTIWGGGDVTLSGVLDRVRITTVNGTDTFDAGSINILYE
jgi:hypothetical protein